MTELPGPQTHVYTPSELNLEAKHHIEAGFGRVWVQGEISNLSKPASGHQYFTLKDGQAQIRCALFKPHASKLSFAPANGDEVLLRGQLSLYAPRGDYQLIADAVFSAGLGALHAQFERLKNALALEGLFDDARKQPLPAWPRTIAIVTSSSGAALRDIRHTLAKRWPVAQPLLFSSLVQGETAPAALIEALRRADSTPEVDVIILARGGGSLEDLWAFNNEALARAVAGLKTPIITGVGHETDTTIVDFVADRRAPTPTGAAVLATPDIREVESVFRGFESRLKQAAGHLLNQYAQQLDIQEQRLLRSHPAQLLTRANDALDGLRHRFSMATRRMLDQRQQNLAALARTLNGLSPLRVLERGYALALDDEGQAIGRKNKPTIGSHINVLTDLFEIRSEVMSIADRNKD